MCFPAGLSPHISTYKFTHIYMYIFRHTVHVKPSIPLSLLYPLHFSRCNPPILTQVFCICFTFHQVTIFDFNFGNTNVNWPEPLKTVAKPGFPEYLGAAQVMVSAMKTIGNRRWFQCALYEIEWNWFIKRLGVPPDSLKKTVGNGTNFSSIPRGRLVGFNQDLNHGMCHQTSPLSKLFL